VAPAVCSVGDVFLKTDAAAGENLYFCGPGQAWTPLGDPGASAATGRPYLQDWQGRLGALASNTANTQATVVWLGDSWTSQNHITDPLRRNLQDALGDAGIGYAAFDGQAAAPAGASVTSTGAWTDSTLSATPGVNGNSTRSTDSSTPASKSVTAAATGFATVLPMDRFDSELKRAAGHGAKVYTIGEDGSGRLHKSLGAEPANPAPAIARLRMVKSAGELELIRKSAEASMAAHRAAWKRTAPGLYEYQVAATMVETYADRGCERSAYAPVVGSGPNALVLHYAKNNRRMDKGELLLMDVGAECAGYAGDITRTVPVSGRFSRRQREVYEVVLGAEKAAIAAVKPGVKVPELTKVARDYMDAHGGLGKYLAHGISHHIGLEVHDAQDLSVPLGEGMVISIEPGIYIPEENIGVRIEDMVLVTADGAKVLTEALPREASQIEKAVGK
jgi:Xaa-Pro aminopeptidase